MNTDKAYRETRQREIILLILQSTRDHPTADQIYEKARKRIATISKGTVYRNLAVLVGRGEIAELNLNGTITRYEMKQQRHYHFRCEVCGRVIDVEQPVDTALDEKVARDTGFKVSYHQLGFRGVCRDCQQI